MGNRLSVIGLGKMGWAYIRTIKNSPSLELVAASEVNPQGAAHLGVPVFGEYRSMLDSVNSDLVVVATPEDTHFGILEEILRRSLNALVEKPVCLTTEDADALEEMAAASKSKVAVNYPIRHSPVLYDAGLLVMLSGFYSTGLEPRVIEISWVKDRTNDPRRNFGALIKDGTHPLDLVLHNLITGDHSNLFTYSKVSMGNESAQGRPEIEARLNLLVGPIFEDTLVRCHFSYVGECQERYIAMFLKNEDGEVVKYFQMAFDVGRIPSGLSIDTFAVQDWKTRRWMTREEFFGAYDDPNHPLSDQRESLLTVKGLSPHIQAYGVNKLHAQLNAVMRWVSNKHIKDPSNPYDSGFDPRVCTLSQGLKNVRLANEIIGASEQDRNFVRLDVFPKDLYS